MKMKRAVMTAMIVLALAAIAVPIIGNRVRAFGTSPAPRALPNPGTSSPGVSRIVEQPAAAVPALNSERERAQTDTPQSLSPEVVKALGIRRLPKGVSPKDASAKIAKKLTAGNAEAQVLSSLPPGTGPGGSSPIAPPSQRKAGGQGRPLVGQPLALNETSALSTALITTIGGRDTQFSEVALLADWDGREDCAADRGAKIDDFSGAELEVDFSLTRAAIS